MLTKKAQSEMLGFGIIIVIVAVVLLIFLSFSLGGDDEELEDKTVETFIQSFLQQTTTCAKDYYPNYRTLSDVISYCAENRSCYSENGEIDPCEIMEEDIEIILENSWNVGENRPDKGYSLVIGYRDKEVLSMSEGQTTQNSRGSSQRFANGVFIQFMLYR